MRWDIEIKNRVKELRSKGYTYGEIRGKIGKKIAKSTLSYMCRGVKLPKFYQQKIDIINTGNREKGRRVALIVSRIKREKYLQLVNDRNSHLILAVKNKDTAKIALAMLYLGEGSKNPKRGSLMFGNSDPLVMNLFLRLLRYCYKIDESKFRCTLQCRADQNIKKLEKFWSQIIKIPLSQFYKARIDPRTIGKPSKKLDYKGVCRIDYFSADLYIELLQIPKIIYKSP